MKVKINNVNSLYLAIDKINGYIEKLNGNQYFLLGSTAESKDTLKRYEELWNKVRDLIRSLTYNSDNYEEKHVKINFNSGYHLPVVVVRAVFHEDHKY